MQIAIGVAFGRMQAAIHAVAVPDDMAQDTESWLNWAGPGDDALRKRLQALNHESPVIMHFDYHPLNVLTDGTRITCVLDWPNTLVGDRRADLARTFTMLRMPIPSPLLRLGQRILQIAWRRGYEQVAGPQGDLRIFYAWAGAGMIYDLAPKIGKEGVWLTRTQLEGIGQWAATQKTKAMSADRQ